MILFVDEASVGIRRLAWVFDLLIRTSDKALPSHIDRFFVETSFLQRIDLVASYKV